MGADELFDVVNEAGEVIGAASRARCHADPRLLHRAVHLFVFDNDGRMFLQRRAATKDIQPGKWDTSVGGHVQQGETVEEALRREMSEELGLDPSLAVELLHQYVWRSPIESELVTTYRCTFDGPFRLQAEEIEAGAFFAVEELHRLAAAGELTPNLEHELRLLDS